MERIAKTICVDNCRSHRNGLLPFVHYGGDNGVFEVEGTMRNGNYGQYVCDFTVYSGGTEESRLRYLDVINKYNFIQEQLRNAVFVKRYTYNYVETTKIICDGDNELNNITETRFKTEFDELYTTPTYNFKPLDITLFNEKDGYYLYNRDEFSDEGELFVLMPNLEIVEQYNEEWNNWWGEHKKEFFNGYVENNTINENFEFCSDIDAYALGRVEVVGDFNGSKVPNSIYYTEIFDRIDWFKANSASTIEAYSKPTKENVWLITQWEENGGGEFYDYLSSIVYSDKWQKIKEIDIDGKILKYSPPKVNLSVILNADIEYETLYTPYEYSVIDEAIESVVYEYQSPSSGVGSALTSHFMEFDSANTVYVESQLQSLIDPMAVQVHRDIFGVFEYFDESGVTGQMFKCTYKEGVSDPPHTMCYHSGKTIVYQFNESGETIGQYEVLSGKTYVDEEPEKCPKPSTNSAYICYATKVKEEFVEVSNTDIKENENESGETYNCYWSATTTSTYRWWECTKCDGDGLECADGEMVSRDGSDNKYRNVTIVSCIDSLEPNAASGETYYVLARFDNGNEGPETICSRGKIHSFKIPYTVGKPLNIVTYSAETESDIVVTYDMVISSVTSNDGYVDIEYVKGATSETTSGVTSGVTISTTGIHYKDRLTYIPNNFDIIPIDGVYPAELYYDTIDLEDNKETIYSEEYRLKREVLRSKITGMEVGTQWTESGAVETMLFTKDGTEGLQEEPKYNINLLYNRGNAAAWENHFKLSECNTLEDLENYGNNFFNL